MRHSSGPPSNVLAAVGAAVGVVLVAVAGRIVCRRFDYAALSNRLKGACLVLVVVCLWTASSIVIQMLLEENRFHRPYFVTYVCFSAQAVLLLRYPRRVREIAGLIAAVCCCDLRLWAIKHSATADSTVY